MMEHPHFYENAPSYSISTHCVTCCDVIYLILLPNKFTVPYKVIIHKSRGEVYLVEQDTIENVSAAYLKFIIILLRKI